MASLTNTTVLHVSQTFRRRGSTTVPRLRPSFRCQSRLPTEPPISGGGGSGGGGGKKRAWWVAMAERAHGSVVKAGMAVQENLSPKQKGDWKDVALMSLSFAVYVYISQKIVCTYCAYVSMIHHH
ncbi:uncharacterized protein [Lolium perenne]|uniref:uncharacterized protein n=1 Tax=Lolium perenne TaxID=4522 RepID=UPI0021EAE51D|nr:uncharacterized protein LOC127296475 [Lolium perenne]